MPAPKFRQKRTALPGRRAVQCGGCILRSRWRQYEIILSPPEEGGAAPRDQPEACVAASRRRRRAQGSAGGVRRRLKKAAPRPGISRRRASPPQEGGAARRGMGMARGGLPFTPRHSGVGTGAVLGLGSAARRAGTGQEEPFEGHPGEWADQTPGSQWDGKGDGLPVPKALFTCPVSRLGRECGKNKELAVSAGPGVAAGIRRPSDRQPNFSCG